MARCLAACISQAPGLRGMPSVGHCWRAATSASCASSSARLMTRTMRTSAPISFADSIRQTASMAAWVSAACTATDHTIAARPPLLFLVGFHLLGEPRFALAQFGGQFRAEVVGVENLPDLDLGVLPRHRIRAALDPLDRFF